MNAAVPDGFGETLAEDAPDVSIADALAILRHGAGNHAPVLPVK